METIIILSGMHFYSYHGCFKEESVIGTHFTVDLTLMCDAQTAAQTDDVRQAVNYQFVYKSVEKVMSQPVHLLETLAKNIIDKVKKDFPTVHQVTVKICKNNPPLGGQIDYVAVEMTD